jgi:Tfp pilus assembly protein PilN
VALERLAARLTGGALGRIEGFSAALTALAQASTDGVWLTGVTLDNTAGQLALEGKALDAARVPLLLAALTRQPRFNGTEFAKMELTRADDAGRATPEGTVHFRIATATLGKGPATQQVAAAASGATP